MILKMILSSRLGPPNIYLRPFWKIYPISFNCCPSNCSWFDKVAESLSLNRLLDLITTGYKNNFHYVCQKKTKVFFKVRKVVQNIVKIIILSLIIVFSLLNLPKHSEKHSENRSENNGYGHL